MHKVVDPIKYIKVQQVSPAAKEIPKKLNPTDVGYQLTLIGRDESRAEDVTHEVNCFLTGLIVSPPEGYYIEIVEMEHLHREGYKLAGCPIINPSTEQSELKIYLEKYRECPDLELPLPCVQLIFRKIENTHIELVKPQVYQQQSQQRQFIQPTYQPSHSHGMRQQPVYAGSSQQQMYMGHPAGGGGGYGGQMNHML